MKDEIVFERFYDYYIKQEYDKPFKEYIIDDCISYLTGKNEEEIVKNARKSKIYAKKDYVTIGIEGVFHSLIIELLKSNIDNYKDIKEEIKRVILNGNISDIDKILIFELEFYNKINQSRLIDLLLDNYIINIKRNDKLEINKQLIDILDEYYADVQIRINRICDSFSFAI